MTGNGNGEIVHPPPSSSFEQHHSEVTPGSPGQDNLSDNEGDGKETSTMRRRGSRRRSSQGDADRSTSLHRRRKISLRPRMVSHAVSNNHRIIVLFISSHT